MSCTLWKPFLSLFFPPLSLWRIFFHFLFNIRIFNVECTSTMYLPGWSGKLLSSSNTWLISQSVQVPTFLQMVVNDQIHTVLVFNDYVQFRVYVYVLSSYLLSESSSFSSNFSSPEVWNVDCLIIRLKKICTCTYRCGNMDATTSKICLTRPRLCNVPNNKSNVQNDGNLTIHLQYKVQKLISIISTTDKWDWDAIR